MNRNGSTRLRESFGNGGSQAGGSSGNEGDFLVETEEIEDGLHTPVTLMATDIAGQICHFGAAIRWLHQIEWLLVRAVMGSLLTALILVSYCWEGCFAALTQSFPRGSERNPELTRPC